MFRKKNQLLPRSSSDDESLISCFSNSRFSVFSNLFAAVRFAIFLLVPMASTSNSPTLDNESVSISSEVRKSSKISSINTALSNQTKISD